MTEPFEPAGAPDEDETSREIMDRGFNQRFLSLEQSNRSLAADVRALTSTLTVVNELQERQRQTMKKQAEIDRSITQNERHAKEREKRSLRVVLGVGLALAVLLPLVSLIVYAGLLRHVNELLDQQQAVAYQSCIARNEGASNSADREATLARLEADPQVKALHANSAAALRKSLLDCNAVKKH